MEGTNTEIPPIKITIPTKEKRDMDENAVNISQRGFGVLDKNAKRGIGTSGLGPCISVLGYEPEAKVLTLAHIDGMTDLEPSISTLVAWLRHAGVADISKMNFTLDGGDETSAGLRTALLNLLKDWKITNITDHNPQSRADVGERKFVVNVADGSPAYGVMPAYPEDPEMRTAKLARTQSTIKTTLAPDYIEVKGKVSGIDL